MELYDAAWEYLIALPTIQAWPELKELLQRKIHNKPPHWWLVVRACIATGGTLQQAVPAMAALGSLFLNIILIDDMLDGDAKGQHHHFGIPATANMASAFQALGYEAIAHSHLSWERQAIVCRRLNWMMMQTTYGQYLDTQNPADEESYWRVTRTKSSPFFATSFFVGALMSGASEKVAAQLSEIGELYGEMIQINDDLNDVMAVPANADWLQGRNPLPILFATLVPHPDRERFCALRSQVAEEWALAEAQEILIRCGAISYGVDQLLRRAGRLQALIDQTPLAQSAVIGEMLEAMLAPVQKLLAQVQNVSTLPLNT